MFRPLLAEKVNLATLQYPVYASPKYDGYRCLIGGDGSPLSRNMKPIPNGYIFAKLKELNLPKIDGELLTFTGDKVDDFNVVQSKLSSRSGMPDFKFMVFDYYATTNSEYRLRNAMLGDWITMHAPKRVEHVTQVFIETEEQLVEYEAEQVGLGWEGIMVRSLDGIYKQGRSTTKEGILLKMKRFTDAEAIVVEAHELMHNANEATTNALGYTERTSHQANMIPMGVLGKFTVRWNNVEFDIGTGFNADQRGQYWNTSDRLIGRTLTFKYQGVGPNGKPRFPVFLGFRHDL